MTQRINAPDEPVIYSVLGDFVAENRGADFGPVPCSVVLRQNKALDRLRFSEPQGASTLRLLRCSRVSAAILCHMMTQTRNISEEEVRD